MRYRVTGPEERTDMGGGRVVWVVPVESPYPSTLQWKQVVRVEVDGKPLPEDEWYSDDRRLE